MVVLEAKRLINLDIRSTKNFLSSLEFSHYKHKKSPNHKDWGF